MLCIIDFGAQVINLGSKKKKKTVNLDELLGKSDEVDDVISSKPGQMFVPFYFIAYIIDFPNLFYFLVKHRFFSACIF